MRYLTWFLVFVLASCATTTPQEEIAPAVKKHVVFLHGSHLDGSAWDLVRRELKDLYEVQAITLPGREKNENPTLRAMAVDACENIKKPSVIVAHSFGGAVANEMAGICADKMQKIVYVAGLVPLDGEKPFAAVNAADQKVYSRIVKFGKDRIYPDAPAIFLRGMDPTISEPPKITLHSESLSAGAAPVVYNEVVFASIPKAYIFTNLDPIITLATQRKFAARVRMDFTASVNSGHLPMFSKPKELAAALAAVIL